MQALLRLMYLSIVDKKKQRHYGQTSCVNGRCAYVLQILALTLSGGNDGPQERQIRAKFAAASVRRFDSLHDRYDEHG
jgi:hypothetical protein